MEFKKYPDRLLRHLLSMPFIYSMIIPLLFFDIWLEIYHRICFPLYGIKYIQRKNYVKIDRHKLKYLTLIERLHCVYCGYANGMLLYACAIAGATEKYWCGIKHRKSDDFHEPAHHKEFIEYGDKEAYQEIGKINRINLDMQS